MEHEHERSLHETLASGLGGEVTDRVVKSGSARPLWLLKPLPLPPHAVQPRFASLAEMCLNVVSAHFDAFRPGDLRLPPMLFRRLMAAVNADRHYSQSAVDRGRPDEGTMWSFVAVHDPEGAAEWVPSHTVALPSASTLQNLPTSTTRLEDREHPLIDIPRIFKALNPDSAYSLLTTLTLDNSVDDAGLQALRWAENLTALWIRNARISDDGLRMLAASLELPDHWEDGKGCWRLRALYLPGCRGVGDRSMRALARWPGLSVLDVRDTSCTEAALQVVNRTSASVFEGQPPFQRCTDGLKELFLTTYDPEEVLDRLAATLLKPDLSKGDIKEEEERRHLSLHVIPGPVPKSEHLHDALRPVWSAEVTPSHRGHYVAGGTGTVWGRNASLVNDHESENRRHAVEWALNFQSHEEAVDRAKAQGKRAPKSWWEKEKEERKKANREFWRGVKEARGYKEAMETNHLAGRVYYPKKRERGTEMVVDREVKGMPDLMMVRLVHPEWWTLSYRRAEEVQQTTVRRSAAGRHELADMLVSVDAGPSLSQSQPQAQISPSQTSSPSAPASQDAQSPAPTQRKTPWITRAPPASLPPPSQSSQGKRNPFAAKPMARPASGVHKLIPASTQAEPLVPDTDTGKKGQLAFSKGRSRGEKKDPLAFLDKGKAKEADPQALVDRSSVRDLEEDVVPPPARRDRLAPAKATPSKDPLAFLPRDKPAPSKAPLKSAAKPPPPAKSLSAPAPSSSAKKRPAPAPAGEPPKRKLTDFFARK